MYFVNRDKIESTLRYMEKCLDIFHAQQSWEDPIVRLGLERITHSIIESIIDVGNSMIDGFIMRDPGSYEDIIDILEDEKVLLETADAQAIREVVRLRKPLVLSYIAMNHEELYEVLSKNLVALERFPSAVRHYLNKELGPVSAFLPKEDE